MQLLEFDKLDNIKREIVKLELKAADVGSIANKVQHRYNMKPFADKITIDQFMENVVYQVDEIIINNEFDCLQSLNEFQMTRLAFELENVVNQRQDLKNYFNQFPASVTVFLKLLKTIRLAGRHR